MAIELPTGYYLDNFQKLIGFVYEQYLDLLTPEEKAFYLDFQELPKPAQFLYVRLISRKGPYFRSDTLRYTEIPDIPQTLQVLSEAQLVRLSPNDAPEWLLHLLKREELLQLATQTPLPSPHLKKLELVQHFLEHETPEVWMAQIAQKLTWLEPLRLQELMMYRLCFFGNLHQDLTEFVLLDLGLIRYEAYQIHQEDRYFQNRILLDQTYQLLLMRQLLEEVLASGDVKCILQYSQQLPYHHDDPTLKRRHNRMINALARQLERLEALEEARLLYQQAEHPPARERQTRILAKQNQLEAALEFCEAMQQNPLTEEEREFAESFGARLTRKLKRPVPVVPKLEIPEDELTLPPPFIVELPSGETHHRALASVELQTVAYFEKQGDRAYYVENQLWNGLFGLAFWDILFMPVRGAFFNLYQRGPQGLFSHEFRKQRQTAIEARLQVIEKEASWPEQMVGTFREKQGISNHFLSWPHWNEDLLTLCLQRIPQKHLACIFDRLSYDLSNNRTGFPDLVVFTENDYELIEVKGPEDRLQQNQKRWIKYFQEYDIPYRVVRVKYA